MHEGGKLAVRGAEDDGSGATGEGLAEGVAERTAEKGGGEGVELLFYPCWGGLRGEEFFFRVGYEFAGAGGDRVDGAGGLANGFCYGADLFFEEGRAGFWRWGCGEGALF